MLRSQQMCAETAGDTIVAIQVHACLELYFRHAQLGRHCCLRDAAQAARCGHIHMTLPVSRQHDQGTCGPGSAGRGRSGGPTAPRRPCSSRRPAAGPPARTTAAPRRGCPPAAPGSVPPPAWPDIAVWSLNLKCLTWRQCCQSTLARETYTKFVSAHQITETPCYFEVLLVSCGVVGCHCALLHSSVL
jgi:hypothetical protein